MKGTYTTNFGTIFNQDCLIDGLQNIKSCSVDLVITDPPYKYLKNQKLEVDFNEDLLFTEIKRILKNDGFIVLFGRGVSFYRWNTIIKNLGFYFKEEIIWNKTQNTSPVTPINRVHETVSIFTKKNGSIKTNYINYTEIKTNPDDIVHDIKRLLTVINNKNEFHDLIAYLEKGTIINRDNYKTKGYCTTVQSKMNQNSKVVKVMQAIKRGMKEKSIIDINREHFNTIHPTQKPVRLLERLIQLCVNKGASIVDPFSGSASTAIAASNLEMKFLGFELDKEYFDLSIDRLKKHTVQTSIF